jgi:hypothetical protein
MFDLRSEITSVPEACDADRHDERDEEQELRRLFSSHSSHRTELSSDIAADSHGEGNDDVNTSCVMLKV